MNTELTPEQSESMFQLSKEALDRTQATMEELFNAADVNRVYSKPIKHEDSLIIPSAEVLAFAGFGMGAGYGSGMEGKDDPSTASKGTGGGGGGGGGGRSFSRPVAVIIASPEGVRVEPVVDVTKIGLAALTAAGFMFSMLVRMRR